jgi:uncharacterized protein YfkK (UPF0435 family)
LQAFSFVPLALAERSKYNMEVASLAIGALTVGSAFNTCLDLYRFVNKARNLPEDLRRQTLLIAVEQQRFEITQGYLDKKPGSGIISDLYDDDQEPGKRLREQILLQLLNTVKHDLEETNSIIEKYDPGGSSTDPLQSESDVLSKAKVGRRKRLTWAAVDKKSIEELATKLRILNDSLLALTPNYVKARSDLDLLNRMIHQHNGKFAAVDDTYAWSPEYADLSVCATIQKSGSHSPVSVDIQIQRAIC